MMMRDTGTLHLYPKVIDAMSECVARGGFGTSVTPVSQFYFQQAYANVTQGPWKKITDGYGKMVLGYFGRTPVPPDPEIVEIAEKQLGLPVFKGDPLDVLEPGIPKAKAILEKEKLAVTDENIFIVGALATAGGNKGLDFLKGNKPINVRKKVTEQKMETEKKVSSGSKTTKVDALPVGPVRYKITVEGETYQVMVEDDTGEVSAVTSAAASGPVRAPVEEPVVEIFAQLPGNVYEVCFKEGDKVKAGDTLVILEAMKMETPVTAPEDGVIVSIEVEKGHTVQSGQLIATLR
jgi:pyruvate carboxylase subunit B